jgi:adenylate cyclase
VLSSRVMVEPVLERVEVACHAAPEVLWPLLSDTQRLNEAAGLAEIHVRPNPEGGAARFLVSSKFGPMSVEWAELPFEWAAPHRLSVRRRVTKGPMDEIRFGLAVSPRGGGSAVEVQLELHPGHLRNVPLARVAAKVAGKKLADGIRRLDEGASRRGGVAQAGLHEKALAAAGARTAELASPDARPHLERLQVFLREGHNAEVTRIRPFALADAWGAPRRGVLEACLAGAVGGLLELSWDVVCPSCRTASERLPQLSALEEAGHCALCDISFGLELDRAVEATFRVAPAVRVVPEALFCTGGPGATPHVVAQAVVGPGESVPLAAPADPGRYRVFARGGGVATVSVAAGQPASVELLMEDAGLSPAQVGVAPGGAVQVRCVGGEARHVKLEHLAWSSQAATAYEVTTVPGFRRLFSREALKPGLGLRVGRAALLFSDLSASTALYAREGDAAAFRLVQDHFDLMEDCIHRHHGAVVKTIGDAVMATFVSEAEALAAGLDAQRAFPAFRLAHPASEGVFLKIGVYAGPCFAVTANGALDYFGQSVNVAARLQGQAEAGEVVAPADLVADAAAELAGFQIGAPFTPTLKGVSGRLEVVRLRPVTGSDDGPKS